MLVTTVYRYRDTDLLLRNNENHTTGNHPPKAVIHSTPPYFPSTLYSAYKLRLTSGRTAPVSCSLLPAKENIPLDLRRQKKSAFLSHPPLLGQTLVRSSISVGGNLTFSAESRTCVAIFVFMARGGFLEHFMYRLSRWILRIIYRDKSHYHHGALEHSNYTP